MQSRCHAAKYFKKFVSLSLIYHRSHAHTKIKYRLEVAFCDFGIPAHFLYLKVLFAN